MKKGSGGGGGGGGAAAEKKKARHSSNTDTPPRKQAAKRDLFQLFAEKVRDHKDLESRWAVLHETRVEYFRGKDFVSFLRNHVELKNILEFDSNLEAEDIANVLLKKNLLVRCDRVVKTVRPGKRKLSTWPAHLEIFPDQVFSDNDAFFAWTFAKRRPLWQTLLSFSWPVLTLAICLFPVYPHRCKLLILYSCASLLLLILCLLLLRGLVFGAGWIFLGKRIWFFPNILAEEATLKELFQFWPPKDEGERPKWSARLFYAVVAVLAIMLLKHHAPDEAARARYQKRVYNIIDDVLEWSPRLALSGMMEKQPVFNASDPNNNYTDGGKANTENVVFPEDSNEETVSEEFEVKETSGNLDEVDENEIEVENGSVDDNDHEHQRFKDL
ncbi:OLC1v1005509C1 [Oldenlandia corymbosa var. corymbosa]|uniref:Translocation protein SEC62 n=1 Tax=Oldenlandia corymbosa var. corymbosa TaxID=529605 RepID=A0AAV1DGS8_OLDCO|nr:OLC1v1005509C1 [Oldenlandia corymbosa var. corymbosa]